MTAPAPGGCCVTQISATEPCWRGCAGRYGAARYVFILDGSGAALRANLRHCGRSCANYLTAWLRRGKLDGMETPIRKVRLSDEHWQGLVEIAAGIVPDNEVASFTNVGTSRVVPMLRMVAEGKLVVVRPEDLPEPRAD